LQNPLAVGSKLRFQLLIQGKSFWASEFEGH
jgi:hypothetical protein